MKALPYAGGLCEQPGPAMQRIEKILDVRNAIDRAETKAAEDQAKEVDGTIG